MPASNTPTVADPGDADVALPFLRYVDAADWLLRSAVPMLLDLVDEERTAQILRELEPFELRMLQIRQPWPAAAVHLSEAAERLERRKIALIGRIFAAGRVPVVSAKYVTEERMLWSRFPLLVEVGDAARAAFTYSRVGEYACNAVWNAVLVSVHTADLQRAEDPFGPALRTAYAEASRELERRVRRDGSARGQVPHPEALVGAR